MSKELERYLRPEVVGDADALQELVRLLARGGYNTGPAYYCNPAENTVYYTRRGLTPDEQVLLVSLAYATGSMRLAPLTAVRSKVPDPGNVGVLAVVATQALLTGAVWAGEWGTLSEYSSLCLKLSQDLEDADVGPLSSGGAFGAVLDGCGSAVLTYSEEAFYSVFVEGSDPMAEACQARLEQASRALRECAGRAAQPVDNSGEG